MWHLGIGLLGLVILCMIAVLIRSEQPRDEVWIMHKERRGEKER